jgi:hypothetical protein
MELPSASVTLEPTSSAMEGKPRRTFRPREKMLRERQMSCTDGCQDWVNWHSFKVAECKFRMN